jgi:uncharacterized protein (TIGR02001 family)
MNSKLVYAGVVLLLFASVALAQEEEDDFGIDISSDFYGKYIWRGQNLSDDPVFQPGIGITWGKFSIGFWGNMDLTNINGNSGDFSEIDYSLDYSDDFPGIEGLSYSVGVIYYDFPGTAVPDTTEVYWGLGFDVLLSPTITVYHDVDEAEGTYVNLGLSHSFGTIAELCQGVPVGLEISSGIGWGSGSYNKYYWGTDQSKMQDLSFSVAFPVEMKSWTITPSLNYVTLLSDDIRDTDVYRTESDYFFAGVSISKSF